MVDALLKIGLNAMSEFSDLRYKLEKDFLDTLDKNELGVNNATANEVVANGVKASRYFVETRYNFEQSILNSVTESNKRKKSEQSSSTEAAPAEAAAEERAEDAIIHSGVLQIKAGQKDSVAFPIKLSNNFEKPQGITVTASEILNRDTGKSISAVFEMEQSNFTIPPNDTSEARLLLALDGRTFKVGCTYTATISIKGFLTKTIDVVLEVAEPGTAKTIAFVAAT